MTDLAEAEARPYQATTSDAPRRHVFTVGDALAMAKAGLFAAGPKLELIDGDFVEMNAKFFFHRRVQDRLILRLARTLPDGWLLAGEQTLALSATTYVSPDLGIYRETGADVLTPSDMPLVIEIADQTLGHDLSVKAGLYAKAGIVELWVINARKLDTWVHRDPGADGYRSVTCVPPDAEVKPDDPALAGLALRLRELDL